MLIDYLVDDICFKACLTFQSWVQLWSEILKLRWLLFLFAGTLDIFCDLKQRIPCTGHLT